MMAFLGFVVLVCGFFLWPAGKVDLRKIDPEKFALSEAGAWRAYYEKRYPALFWHVFQWARSGCEFSWGDTTRLAFHAARAASHFRSSNTPENIAAALHHIEDYYRIISEASLQPFDHKKAAALELEWWQMRRKKSPPEDWATTITHQCEIVYGLPREIFLPSVSLRVHAMVLRDSKRKSPMSDTDWMEIQNLLTEAARQFGAVVQAPVSAHLQGPLFSAPSARLIATD